jgi:ADP-ribose pyrophosphatase YjhB (NUDIX family)
MCNPIRLRVCLAVVKNERILLVPHYFTDSGSVQWLIPGGEIEFGESLKIAAIREFFEETGFRAEIISLLNVTEVIHPKRQYHSITIAFSGNIIDGKLQSEANHPYGEKVPRWFTATQLMAVKYHPEKSVEIALGI